jgi:hypothetical protein
MLLQNFSLHKASLVVEDGSEQMPEGKVWPQRVGEIKYGRWYLKE